MLRALASPELQRRENVVWAHCVEAAWGAIRSSIFYRSVLQTQLRKPGIECRAASREPFGGAKRSTSRLNSRGGARSVVRRRGIREEIIGRMCRVLPSAKRGRHPLAAAISRSRCSMTHRASIAAGNFFHH